MNIAQIKASKGHAFSTLSNLQSSYRKVNLIMDAIRGVDAAEALFRLEFMRNKNAISIHKLVKAALDNADQKMIEGSLMVQHAFASRAKVLRRVDYKGRGRSGVKEKPYCHVTVVVAAKGAVSTIENKARKTEEAVKAPVKKAETKKTTEKRGKDGSKS